MEILNEIISNILINKETEEQNGHEDVHKYVYEKDYNNIVFIDNKDIHNNIMNINDLFEIVKKLSLD